MWKGQALPHDTKFRNCRGRIVDSRAFPSWSLIHGSSWSGFTGLAVTKSPQTVPCTALTNCLPRRLWNSLALSSATTTMGSWLFWPSPLPNHCKQNKSLLVHLKTQLCFDHTKTTQLITIMSSFIWSLSCNYFSKFTHSIFFLRVCVITKVTLIVEWRNMLIFP